MAKKVRHLQMQKSEKLTERQLEQLADTLDEISERRINQYTCTTCGGAITTIDRDAGTTPMFLNCRATEGCGGRMQSHMYRVDPTLEPEWEWYKPTNPKGADREYVKMGGLLIRRIEVVK